MASNPFEEAFSGKTTKASGAANNSASNNPFESAFSSHPAIKLSKATSLESFNRPTAETAKVHPAASWLGRTINNTLNHVADLPMGVVTAVANPFLQVNQDQLDSQYQGTEKKFLQDLTTKGIIDPQERAKHLVAFRKAQGDIPNVLKDFNSKVMDPGYANEIGGTFFDVATAGLGGAEASAAIKGGEAGAKLVGKELVKALAKKAGARMLETGALSGARAASQGESAPDIAKQTGFGSLFGLPIAGLETLAVKLASRKAATAVEDKFTSAFDHGAPNSPPTAGVSQEPTVLIPKNIPNEPTVSTHNNSAKGYSDLPVAEKPKPFNVSSDPVRFNKQRQSAIENYMMMGKTDITGAGKENAGLSILEAQSKTPQGKAAAQSELRAQVKSGKIKSNADGTITVYRGGEPNPNVKLVSVSTDKTAAAEHGPITEYRVSPDQIAVARKGLDSGELLVKKEGLVLPSKIEVKSKIPAGSQDLAVAVDQEAKNFSNIKSIKFTDKRMLTPETGEATFSKLDPSNGQLIINLKDLESMAAEDGYVGNDKIKEYLRKEVLPFEAQHVDNYGKIAIGDAQGMNSSDIAKELDAKAVADRNATQTGTSKVGVNIEEKAVAKKLIENFGGTAGYDKVTVKEQSKMATDIVNKDLAAARDMANGNKPLPSKLRGAALITALEERGINSGDSELLLELANSPLVSKTSRHAQELRLLAERAENSPVKKIQDVQRARIEAAGGEDVVKKKIKVEVDKGQKDLNRVKPKIEELNNFINSIRC